MSGDWAQYETVRGKGSTVNCMFCGRKPIILEKGFHDGSHAFSISCPHCWNKYFRDKKETGVDITVCSETIYPGIRDWNKINGAFEAAKKQFEKPHGEWIDLSDGWQEGTFRCSSCQMEFVLVEGTPEDNEYNFCPNCGADMRSKEGGKK